MAARDIIVIGASAGGVETLTRLCSMLPAGLPAAIFVVVHVPATAHSMLPKILSRAGSLPAVHPQDGDRYQPGTIYVAPPDRQMRLVDGAIDLSRGPMENGHRPAIDVLFRSAAQDLRERVVGVVLSGMLSDGALGLRAIQSCGGVAIVQDPSEALFPSMPENALFLTREALVLPLNQIAGQIVMIAGEQEGPLAGAEVSAGRQADLGQPRQGPGSAPENLPEVTAVEDQKRFEHDQDATPRTLLTCPECGGVLSEIVESGAGNGEKGTVRSYRCHVGHRYSMEGLIEGHAQMVERALWAAHRALMERVMLTRRLASQAEEGGRMHSAVHFNRAADMAEQEAGAIRGLIERGFIPNGGQSESDRQEG